MKEVTRVRRELQNKKKIIRRMRHESRRRLERRKNECWKESQNICTKGADICPVLSFGYVAFLFLFFPFDVAC